MPAWHGHDGLRRATVADMASSPGHAVPARTPAGEAQHCMLAHRATVRPCQHEHVTRQLQRERGGGSVRVEGGGVRGGGHRGDDTRDDVIVPGGVLAPAGDALAAPAKGGGVCIRHHNVAPRLSELKQLARGPPDGSLT